MKIEINLTGKDKNHPIINIEEPPNSIAKSIEVNPRPLIIHLLLKDEKTLICLYPVNDAGDCLAVRRLTRKTPAGLWGRCELLTNNGKKWVKAIRSKNKIVEPIESQVTIPLTLMGEEKKFNKRK